jgi:hypothetical protein
MKKGQFVFSLGHECHGHFLSRSTTLRSVCCDVLAGVGQSVWIHVEIVLVAMSPFIFSITMI